MNLIIFKNASFNFLIGQKKILEATCSLIGQTTYFFHKIFIGCILICLSCLIISTRSRGRVDSLSRQKSSYELKKIKEIRQS